MGRKPQTVFLDNMPANGKNSTNSFFLIYLPADGKTNQNSLVKLNYALN
jgi:hypothetical protein